jgi:hypothetical protein
VNPHAKRVEFVRDRHIPALNPLRTIEINLRSENRDYDAQTHALEAARMWGIEEEVIRASEDLRRAVWSAVWDSTWVDAWKLSWVVARAGIGLMTTDLIGLGDYTIEDYVALVAPWTAGFPDLPIPYEREEAA